MTRPSRPGTAGVLVLAAHPDDAEMAAGGTIATLTDRGVPVMVVFFTVSEGDDNARFRRRDAAGKAATVLGHDVSWVEDGQYDQVDEIVDSELVRLVDALVDLHDPKIVITHWDGDSHGDHVRLANATVASSRRWPQRTLLQFGPNEYRTPRYATFVPTLYVGISAQLDRKLESLRCYSDAGLGVRALDVEAVRCVAQSRGLEVGLHAAEGFRLVRACVDGDHQPRSAGGWDPLGLWSGQ